MLHPDLIDLFRQLSSHVPFASLRYQKRKVESLTVKNDVLQPLQRSDDEGYMLTVLDQGGTGYCASSDLSANGMKKAFDSAKSWSSRLSSHSLIDFSKIRMPHPRGEFKTPMQKSWSELPMAERIERLNELNRTLDVSNKIVLRIAGMSGEITDELYLTSSGGKVHQRFERLMPTQQVTAGDQGEFQTRTFGRGNICWQGGVEVLEREGFFSSGESLAHEAVALLSSPSCPEGRGSLILDPDQMFLQIHESIGHPLELDRILGDERNFAGTSFVTLDMFGKYQYGSKALNITFDPSIEHEAASYRFDDEGMPAEKTHIIKDGLLLRPIGGLTSQHRTGLPGVAAARATNWRRPAIDRMSNLNLEPGNAKLEDMISGIDRGIYMKTNCSWSIDDSRNKFQFGCELGYLVENGRIKHMLRQPNYRGVSAEFWRNLAMVGDASTVRVLGSPYCGKGEPNQAIAVGHSSPTCLFQDVEYFGGSV